MYGNWQSVHVKCSPAGNQSLKHKLQPAMTYTEHVTGVIQSPGFAAAGRPAA